MLKISTNQVNHVKRYFQEWSYSMLKTIPHNFQSLEFVLFINSWYKKNPCSKHVQITLHKLWHFRVHLFSEVHNWMSRRVNKIKHNTRVYSHRALTLERKGIHLINSIAPFSPSISISINTSIKNQMGSVPIQCQRWRWRWVWKQLYPVIMNPLHSPFFCNIGSCWHLPTTPSPQKNQMTLQMVGACGKYPNSRFWINWTLRDLFGKVLCTLDAWKQIKKETFRNLVQIFWHWNAISHLSH